MKAAKIIYIILLELFSDLSPIIEEVKGKERVKRYEKLLKELSTEVNK